MEIKKSYYAVIPASVRYDKSLPAAAKLLYGEITALCNQSGLCWAENSYFAELYEVNIRTVQSWINALLDKKYIFRNIQYAEDGKTVLRRCLSIASENTTPVKNFARGGDEIVAAVATKKSPIIIQPNTTTNIKGDKPPTPTKSKAAIFNAMVDTTTLPDSVKDALHKWLDYKKHNYQERSFEALLTIVQKKVEEYGAEAVVDLVDECMANTWKGLIWEKLLKLTTSQAPPKRKRNYDEED